MLDGRFKKFSPLPTQGTLVSKDLIWWVILRILLSNKLCRWVWTQHPTISSRQHCLTCLLQSTQLTTAQFPLILTPLGRYLHNTCTVITADTSDHSRQHRVTPDLVIILVAGGEEGGGHWWENSIRGDAAAAPSPGEWRGNDVTSVADYFHPRYPPPGQGRGLLLRFL